jgi:hypothetical protein
MYYCRKKRAWFVEGGSVDKGNIPCVGFNLTVLADLQQVSTEYKHNSNDKGDAVAQLVETRRYKPEGRGFHPRMCHWKFSLT